MCSSGSARDGTIISRKYRRDSGWTAFTRRRSSMAAPSIRSLATRITDDRSGEAFSLATNSVARCSWDEGGMTNKGRLNSRRWRREILMVALVAYGLVGQVNEV